MKKTTGKQKFLAGSILALTIFWATGGHVAATEQDSVITSTGSDIISDTTEGDSQTPLHSKGIVNYDNKIIFDAADLSTLDGRIDLLTSSVDAIKKSVSDGKALLASTITSLGVSASGDDSFQTLSDDIVLIAENKYSEGYEVGIATGKQIVDLGVGTSFDLTWFEGYENLTDENFLIVPVAYSFEITGYHMPDNTSGNNTCYISCTGTPSQSYDASSGTLSARQQILLFHHAWAYVANNFEKNESVHAYLVY